MLNRMRAPAYFTFVVAVLVVDSLTAQSLISTTESSATSGVSLRPASRKFEQTKVRQRPTGLTVRPIGNTRQGVSHPGDQNVRVAARGFALSATLTVPVNQPRPPAGWPAVLLIPGSTAPDRDGTLSGVPVLGRLATVLTEAGFLTVRYDRRGVGQSGGRPESAKIDSYADDARSMVRYVNDRNDINRDRITVLGHAEGGWTALMVTAQENLIDNLVLIGTPSTTGSELIMEQQLTTLQSLGMSSNERTERIALQQGILDAVMEHQPWTDIPEQIRRQAQTPWFRSFLEFDPADTIRRTRQPILVIHGLADRHVSPHHATRLTELASLRQRGALVEKVLLSDLDHTLVETGPTAAGSPQNPQQMPVAPSLIEPLVRWLQEIP